MSSSPASSPAWLDRSQPNALNVLRLSFASAVVFSHAWPLGGFGPEPTQFFGPAFVTAGSNAVNGFFFISGFLVTGSWCSGCGAEAYLRARIARIWPGYVVCFFASALIAALAAGSDGLGYLRSIPIRDYFAGALAFKWQVLERPLAFPHLPWYQSVNEALWTIPFEVGCYLGVAGAGVIGLLHRRGLVLLGAALCLVLAAHDAACDPEKAAGNWPRFGSFFGMGAVFFLYRESISRKSWLAVGAAGALLGAWHSALAACLVAPIAGGYLLLYAAYHAPAWSKRLGAHPDISYGTYLYAFPVQQLYYQCALANRVPNSPWMNFGVSLAVALCLGWLSWRWVERPAQRLIRRL
ncbi:MAG: acyltransferase [Opitutaceae bacterium]|nr:acyltransferase [Opitutaceae bacterium]